MSEYNFSRVDIPWAKHYSADTPLVLPEGTSALIPDPESDGYKHLTHEQYAKIMTGLTRSTRAVELGANHVQNRARADSFPASRIQYHAHRDGVIIPKEPTTERRDRGE